MSRALSFEVVSLVILNSYNGFLTNLSRPPISTYPHFPQLKFKTKTTHLFNVFSLLTRKFKNRSIQLKNTTKRLRQPRAMSRICLEAFSSLITKTNTQFKSSSGDDRGLHRNYCAQI
jgi:hypothetical protein